MAARNIDEETIFKFARKVASPTDRNEYLQQICGDDTALLARVEALLEVDQLEPEFLNVPPSGVDATIDASSIAERPGTVIGHYKLMEEIGEGGFGLVFVAEQQQPLRRKVALKIIKPGMDTKEVIARFEAERQALALMDHPNIARVLDAGATDSGRPYFVMELVKGIPIIDYCDQQQLTTRERLELFVSVCQAVQHAHAKGIIHRDLKPTNILVAPHDGVPVVKVIDFGVAKAIGQQLTDKTIYTRFAQMIGTPLYMSPEQAELNALDVDTRSDIYSLGVLLYELLTGTTPFDHDRFATAAYDEIRRIIREEEPPKPSRRLSTLGETLPMVSAKRKTEPARLSALVKGDLDWIVMKALEKDRTRRYETANGFAADIRRHLADEAVEACPPSTAYRLRKYVRRNKLAVAAAAAVSLSLIAGIAASTTGLVLAKKETARADWQERQTKKALIETEDAQGRQEREAKRAREAERKAKEETEARRREQYISDMNAAMLAWEENNIGEFERLLDRYVPRGDEPDLRTFEWFYMRRLGTPYRQAEKIDVGDVVQDVAFIPGTKMLAVAHGYDRAGSLWNTETLEREQRFGAKNCAAYGTTFLAISPDGQTIAYPGPDYRQVVLYHHTTGRREPLEFTSHNDMLRCVAFSPDGDLLAVGVSDGPVEIWDLKIRKQKTDFRIGAGMHSDSSQAIAFSPDGSMLAAGGRAGEVKVWDIQTGEEIHEYKQRGGVRAVVFSPRGKFLASASESPGSEPEHSKHELRILDLQSDMDWPLVGHEGNVYCVAFSPDESLLASGGVDRTVQLWDTADRSRVDMLKGHLGSVRGISFSEDGEMLASASTDHTVLLWDVSQSGPAVAASVVDFPPTGSRYFAERRIAFLPQDNRLVILGRDAFTVLNCDTLQQQTTPAGSNRPERTMAISECGLLALASMKGRVELWNPSTEELIRKLPELGEDVSSLAFSPDGTVLAAGTYEGSLKLWRADTESSWRSLVGHTGSIDGLNFRPDGEVLASVSPDGKAILWNVASGKEWRSFDVGYGAAPEDVAFSPDGQTLAVAAFFRGVLLFDLSDTSCDPDVLRTVAASVLFSADGKTLFVGGAAYSTAIQVWDVSSRRLRCRFTGHEASVCNLAISPDGRTLASTGRDLTVRFWRTTADSTVRSHER